ncbi:MAG: alpha/beta hydrolase family protein [Phycisphaerales bacterium]
MPDLSGSALPSSLKKHAQTLRLADDVPALVVVPDAPAQQRLPVMVWMHGRTANKELDPGRYLRWMRAGIATCSVDLPGHGDRFDASLQQPGRAFDVLNQMLREIDAVVAALLTRFAGQLNEERIGIGGMSLGGMTALARLTTPHRFRCAAVEATSGSWQHQRGREMFRSADVDAVASLDPITNLDGWREIPLLALHTIGDEWVAYDGQKAFIDALRTRSRHPERIEFHTWQDTGAPFEHAGFGRYAADAKNLQTAFLSRYLKA